jgi:hypothetical protein
VLDILELCTDSLKQEFTEHRRILAAREEVRQQIQRAEGTHLKAIPYCCLSLTLRLSQ